MSWRIDRDYLETSPNVSRVGTQVGELSGDTYRWRTLDDDGEVYYGGAYDVDAATNDESDSGLYGALEWCRWDAGCVDLQVKVADGLRFGLTSERMTAGMAPDAWVSIYG